MMIMTNLRTSKIFRRPHPRFGLSAPLVGEERIRLVPARDARLQHRASWFGGGGRCTKWAARGRERKFDSPVRASMISGCFWRSDERWMRCWSSMLRNGYLPSMRVVMLRRTASS